MTAGLVQMTAGLVLLVCQVDQHICVAWTIKGTPACKVLSAEQFDRGAPLFGHFARAINPAAEEFDGFRSIANANAAKLFLRMPAELLPVGNFADDERITPAG